MTVHTDKLGLVPWAFLAIAAYAGWQAYEGFISEDGSRLGIYLGAAIICLLVAARRFWQVHFAVRSNEDNGIARGNE